MEKKQNTSKTNYLHIAGIIVICSLIFGIIGYFLGRQSVINRNLSQIQITIPSPTSAPQILYDTTSNWKTYKNATYNLSLMFPPDYSLTESTQNQIQSKLLSVIIKNINPTPGGGYPQPHIEIVVFKN